MPAFVSIERRSFGFFWFERWIPDSLEIVGEILKITVGENLTEIYIPDILEMRAVHESEVTSLKTKDLPQNFERLILTIERKEYVLKAKFFRKANFRKFIEILVEVWSESVQGFEDKMTSLRKKCTKNIERDKQLEKEFQKKLIQICESMYQPFHVQINSHEIEKIASNPDTIFYYKIDSRFYRYYRKSAPKSGSDPKNIETAQNMTQAVLTNLKATSERIASYEKVLENVKKRRHQQRNRQKLSGLIDDLEKLQMQNSTRAFHEQMTGEEGDILNELDDFFGEYAEVAEKSEMLKNYASTFEETLNNESSIDEVDKLLSAEEILNLSEDTGKLQIFSVKFTYQKTKESFEVDFANSNKLILGRRAVGEYFLSSISQISREHCELIREGNEVRIRDLNSTNGTYFGRIKKDCRTPQVLQDDSIVYLGREEFKLNFIYK